MRYKGFNIKAVYSVGSDFNINKDGIEKTKRPSVKDIEYYEVLDPMEGNNRWLACTTQLEAKGDIDNFLNKVGMKSNLKSEWNKLEVKP